MSKARLFRKKPIAVEAVQFTDFGQHGGAYEFAQANGIGYFDNGDRAWPEVHTLGGVIRMEPLDWLITGINGEKYPCKPDIFEATYEPVVGTGPDGHAPTLTVPAMAEENARLKQRIDWLFDTLLIDHLDCGFDVYVREPVPGWFLDELAARWARREGGSVDEYRHALEMHGWQEEAPSE